MDRRRSSARRLSKGSNTGNGYGGGVWVEAMDERTGLQFYHNVITGKSVWRLPPDHWYKCRDLLSERWYYFNLYRHEATWAEPTNYQDNFHFKWQLLPYSPVALGLDGEHRGFQGYVPAFDPHKGWPYWHSMNDTVWKRPRGSVYVLEGVTEEEEYESLETHARLLQSAISDLTDEIERLSSIEEQIEETAEARAKRLANLNGERRASQAVRQKTLRQKGVTRYLETSFGRAAIRTSMRTTTKHTIDSFLKSVPLFHNLNEEQFELVRENLHKQTFEPKEVIVRQDTRGDLFYLVLDGKVRVYVAGAWSEDQGLLPEDNAFGKFVNELSVGDWFGEKALLEDRLRSATVVAATKVTTYTLSREIFSQVIDHQKVDESLNSSLSQMNFEVSSFTKHVGNYDVLLSLKRRANTQREGRVAEALMLLMTSFSPELNVADTVSRMRKTLFQIFNCERVTLYSVDWEAKTLLAQYGDQATEPDEQLPPSLKVGQGIAGHCAAINKIVNVPHVHKNEHFYGDIFEKDFVTRSVLCCPVTTEDGTVIAVIELINKRGGAPFSEEDEHVVASVSEQMSLTLAQKRSEESNDFSLLQYLPIWKLDTHLSFGVKRFLGTSLPGHMVSDSIIVSTTIYHADQQLAPTVYVAQTAERLTPYMVVAFDELINLDISLSNLPRAARVIFNVYFSPRKKDDLHNELLDSIATGKVDVMNMGSSATLGSRRRGVSDTTAISSVDDARASTSTGLGSDKDREKEKKKEPRRGLGFAERTQRRRQRKQKPQLDLEQLVQDHAATPIGWAGMTLLDFDQVLRNGHLRLRLFRGEAGADVAAVATLLTNNTRAKDAVDFLELELPAYEKPVVYSDFISEELKNEEQQGAPAPQSNLYKQIQQELDRVIASDPLTVMTPEEKFLVLQSRTRLMADPAALPKFLQALDWGKRSQIQLAYRMLNRWEMPDPVVALQLLDFKHPDPKVRALAVSALEALRDPDLELYMLQLVQVLKFERFVDSALSRFLLRRALRSPGTIGHRLFWLLRAEMHVPEVADRYGALLDIYLRHCKTRTELGHQQFVLNKLDAIAHEVKSAKPRDRTSVLQKLLKETSFPPDFQLPLSPEFRFRGFSVKTSKVMNSKKAPLNLECLPVKSGAASMNVLYKSGDDIRQDQLTIQVLRVMDRLWKQEGLDMQMSLYGVVATGDLTGMIQIVPNSETIARITAGKRGGKLAKAVKVFDEKKLKRFLVNSGYSRKVTEHNFCYSCAGYCVATYVLGLADRHNDNLMMTKDGKLFHIDFGHFLGHFKSKLGVKRERAPFIFTPAMAAILGKQDKPLFKKFVTLCTQAYNLLRKNANLLVTLFSLMLSSGLPELQRESDIDWLREKLTLDATDEQAAEKFKLLIQESLASWTVQLNDFAHIYRRN